MSNLHDTTVNDERIRLAEDYMATLFAIGMTPQSVFERTMDYILDYMENRPCRPDRTLYTARVVLCAAQNLHVDAESLRHASQKSGVQ